MNVFKHRTRLKKLLKQLQVNISISMFRNDMAILPYIKDGSKKILEFHFSYPLFKLSHRKGLLGIYDKLQNNFIKHIKKYDKFIVLTKEDIDYWDDLLNIDSIPNARTFVCDSPAELNNKIACTVGSLIYRKGYDRLIEAWSKISLIVPDWKLYIYGSGSLQNELQNKINEAGLTDNILLKGVITDIKTCYLQSSLFILTSRLEGLPMCILEAQSAGLPIVSYNCPCGPRDVIENGKDGFIIENNDMKRSVY